MKNRKSYIIIFLVIVSIGLQSCYFPGHKCDTFSGTKAKKSKVKPITNPNKGK